jgi:hypothetical protein
MRATTRHFVLHIKLPNCLEEDLDYNKLHVPVNISYLTEFSVCTKQSSENFDISIPQRIL